jgi:murein tripeptide amidase MpaA
VIAELGLETRKGESRKPDHDVVNAVLDMAYQPVVDEVERRYDPLLAFTNPDGVPADDAAGLELVRTWRELVWRNAERLTNAESEAERREVADSIERNAAQWAEGIAAFQTPGDRARRDAYCEAQLADAAAG